MILRPYQENLVSRAVKALAARGNTLAVAATGAGKTIALSALAQRVGGRTLVLQHRDELVDQNEAKFRKVNPGTTTSKFNATEKDFNGEATFAMVQSLVRGLHKLPDDIHHVIVDEAHHCTADTYLRILDAVRERNPNMMLSGFTATPARGDGKGLRRAGFDNVCDEITIGMLVDLGFLVPPKAYRCQLEDVDLSGVRKTAGGEYDMEQVEDVLDVEIHNKAVVEKWQEYAGGRKTIAFCSTIQHAVHVCEAFTDAGIVAAVVTGDTDAKKRADILHRFDHGDIQVLCNVAVLTEGYDSQPVSCVILLRPCSYKSTMMQMIGRGLRTVDPAMYPGVYKEDCIVLDFGQSLESNGELYSKPRLEDRTKECPSCGSELQLETQECPICGFVFESPGTGKMPDEDESDIAVATKVEMVEIEILKQSPFRWVDLFGSGKVMIAKGFDAAVFTVSRDGERYLALGQKNKQPMQLLQKGRKPQCLSAADDFLRQNEDGDAAGKAKRWLRDTATERQWELLQQAGYARDALGLSMTKYSANCHLAFQWARRHIEKHLGV